jgi:shikimate kinase
VSHHVVLLGLMGSGKTSIGSVVADRLGWPLVDGDEWLEQRFGGRTAAQIADDRGLDALHELEAEIALAALDLAEPAVIGPAASVCESSAVRDALADHHVVWLTASPDYLAREAAAKSHRPLVDRPDALEIFERQLAVRQPLVLPLAELVVDVSAVTVEEAAEQVVDLVGRG